MRKPMLFTDEQLLEHDEQVRRELRSETVRLVESYAEGCRAQALAQGVDSDREMLRGSVSACQFLASVLAMQN